MFELGVYRASPLLATGSVGLGLRTKSLIVITVARFFNFLNSKKIIFHDL